MDALGERARKLYRHAPQFPGALVLNCPMRCNHAYPGPQLSGLDEIRNAGNIRALLSLRCRISSYTVGECQNGDEELFAAHGYQPEQISLATMRSQFRRAHCKAVDQRSNRMRP